MNFNTHEKIVILMDRKDRTYPGDILGTTEEFLPGKGTYVEGNHIRSKILGSARFDRTEMMVSVEPMNGPAELADGDIVIAEVIELRNSMVNVRVERTEKTPRQISGDSIGTLHISNISKDFVDNVGYQYRLGDIIRARVIKSKPSLQLTTEGEDLGVVLARCLKCRGDLEVRSEELYCSRCERVEERKTASDYGYQKRADVLFGQKK